MLTSAGKHAHKNIISACLVGITLNLAGLYAYICTSEADGNVIRIVGIFSRKDLKDFELWLTQDTSNYVTTRKVQNSPVIWIQPQDTLTQSYSSWSVRVWDILLCEKLNFDLLGMLHNNQGFFKSFI